MNIEHMTSRSSGRGTGRTVSRGAYRGTGRRVSPGYRPGGYRRSRPGYPQRSPGRYPRRYPGRYPRRYPGRSPRQYGRYGRRRLPRNAYFRDGRYYGYGHNYGTYWPWWLQWYPSDWYLYPDVYPIPPFWWQYAEIPTPPQEIIVQNPSLAPPADAVVPERITVEVDENGVDVNGVTEAFSGTDCALSWNALLVLLVIIIILIACYKASQ